MNGVFLFCTFLILFFSVCSVAETLQAKRCRGTWSESEPPPDIIYMSFAEAKEFVQALEIKTPEEFFDLIKSEERPYDLPSNPGKVYSEEWQGWDDFFGIAPSENLNDYEATIKTLKQIGSESSTAGFDSETASSALTY